MKNSIALAIALVAIVIVAAPEANAQTFNNGFLFGSGIGASGRSNFRSGSIRPPYFAEFPPVYYNGIVRRPYGISPYAAPAGVVPVELNFRPENIEPAVINNPHFQAHPTSVMNKKTEVEAKSEMKNKSVKVTNPFFSNTPGSLGSVMQASFEALER